MTRHFKDQIKGFEAEYQNINQKVLMHKSQYTEARKAMDKVGRFGLFRHVPCTDFCQQLQEGRASVEVRQAKVALANLQQEANDDLPVGMAGFEAAKKVRLSPFLKFVVY